MSGSAVERAFIVFFRLAMGWTFLYAASHQIFDPNWSVVAESYYRFTNLPNYLTSTLSLMTSVNRLRGSKPRYQITAEQLVTITQPVLYLWGTRDPFGSVETGRESPPSCCTANSTLWTTEGISPGSTTPNMRAGS